MKKWRLEKCDSNEVLSVVKSVDEIVSYKLQHVNVVLPALMAIVTPILAYLFVTKISKEQMVVFEIATLCVLLAFGILIWANIPLVSRSQKKTNKIDLEKAFVPSDLRLSAYLSDEDFLKAYQSFFGRAMTIEERTAVALLKNKINDLRFRVNCLGIVYGIILLGVLVVLVALVLLIAGVEV